MRINWLPNRTLQHKKRNNAPKPIRNCLSPAVSRVFWDSVFQLIKWNSFVYRCFLLVCAFLWLCAFSSQHCVSQSLKGINARDPQNLRVRAPCTPKDTSQGTDCTEIFVSLFFVSTWLQPLHLSLFTHVTMEPNGKLEPVAFFTSSFAALRSSYSNEASNLLLRSLLFETRNFAKTFDTFLICRHDLQRVLIWGKSELRNQRHMHCDVCLCACLRVSLESHLRHTKIWCCMTLFSLNCHDWS